MSTFISSRQVVSMFGDVWRLHLTHTPDDTNDKPAKRLAFCTFVDELARSEQISERVASAVTLPESAK